MIKINNNQHKIHINIPQKVQFKNITNRSIKISSKRTSEREAKQELFSIMEKLGSIKQSLLLFKFKLKNFLIYDELDPLSSVMEPKAIASKMNKATVSSIWKVLKPYFKILRKEINPAEIDRRLTKLVGKNNVIEEPFIPNPKMGITMGRKRIYTLKNGRKIVLECHDDTKRNRVVVRLSDINKDKKSRTYLGINGDFIRNSHTSSQTHLISGRNGIEWIMAA